jgi:uncharacterized damage-inducible protein DinB
MSLIQSLLKEMNQEAETTRKMLSRVPDGQYDWQPHEKSMNIRRLATHIAELPSWVSMALNTSGLDFAKNPYSVPTINNTKDLLAYFEQSFLEGRSRLEQATEEELEGNWTLRNGDQVYSVNRKADVIRRSFTTGPNWVYI